MRKLQKEYSLLVSEYISAFEKKHDIEFDYWVGDEVGEIAVFGDFFFNFDDIRRDVDDDVPEKKIFEWYDLTLDSALKDESTMNFKTFLKIKL